MAVARSQFAGTHLENAPQWLLEIEELTIGGWRLKHVPRVREEDRITRHRESGSKSASVARSTSAVSRHQ